MEHFSVTELLVEIALAEELGASSLVFFGGGRQEIMSPLITLERLIKKRIPMQSETLEYFGCGFAQQAVQGKTQLQKRVLAHRAAKSPCLGEGDHCSHRRMER